MAEGFNLKCGCAVSTIPLVEHLFSLTYCAQHNSFTLHKASPGHTSDWIQPIYDHFIAARAAATPADLEARLAEARAELSEAEYLALVGRLSSASNVEAEEKVWCGVCRVWRLRSELTHWTGDSAHHWLCPGCDRDLLRVLSEDDYFASLGITDDKGDQ